MQMLRREVRGGCRAAGGQAGGPDGARLISRRGVIALACAGRRSPASGPQVLEGRLRTLETRYGGKMRAPRLRAPPLTDQLVAFSHRQCSYEDINSTNYES